MPQVVEFGYRLVPREDEVNRIDDQRGVQDSRRATPWYGGAARCALPASFSAGRAAETIAWRWRTPAARRTAGPQ